jgi:hypothetical protein
MHFYFAFEALFAFGEADFHKIMGMKGLKH